MPQYPHRQFLDFEQPIKELYEQIEQANKIASKSSENDLASTVQQLEESILVQRKTIVENLTPWQKVQLSRHPDRPYALKYIRQMTTDFVEMHGDRKFKDDKAIVGGFAKLNGQTVMFIGQQKGTNTKNRQFRNFGMANPSGYRKSLRLMKLAEKFGKPIVTLIDTPGAYPGVEAEEHGGGEAVARCMYEMMRLQVPVICVVIGEGGSGGALAIGIGDKVLMMENTWYTVVSPESCSAILWHNWDNKEVAAEQLQLTATHIKAFGIIDEIVPEPVGGAHWDYAESASILKKQIISSLQEVQDLWPAQRIKLRIEKFRQIGFWDER